MQCLGNPNYLNFLAQRGYFKDPAMINYLSYLRYWSQPEYVKFIKFPVCLHFLELLQHEAFRKEIANGAVSTTIANNCNFKKCQNNLLLIVLKAIVQEKKTLGKKLWLNVGLCYIDLKFPKHRNNILFTYLYYVQVFLPAYIRSRLTKDSCNSSCCCCSYH